MIRKRFFKTKCHIVFEWSETLSEQVESVYLVGDFNNWEARATPMDRGHGGKFTANLDLDPDREYQFRYLINGRDWRNEVHADRYELNPCQEYNSVISTQRADEATAYV